MMTEQQTPASVVERLREIVGDQHLLPGHPVRDALDELERLSAEREGLREALTEIAGKGALNYDVGIYATEYQDGYGEGYDMASGECAEIARATLTQGESRQSAPTPADGSGE